MEPILNHSPLENQSQPISIQTDEGIENNPIKTPNTIKIGLFIFLWIIVFFIVALWYAASNYQGIPKEISSNETLSTISKSIFGQQSVSQTAESSNTTNTSDSEKWTEMIVTNPEKWTETVLPDSVDWSGTILAQGEDITELSPDTENQETPPESMPSDTTEVPSENAIILDVCADGSCNNGCWPTEYWNGTTCLEAWKYKTHATQCITNSANNLPSGYFVGHFLWDSGDCAWNDYNVWDYSNIERIRATNKCQSWKMICKKQYSDSCILSTGICTCYKE